MNSPRRSGNLTTLALPPKVVPSTVDSAGNSVRLTLRPSHTRYPYGGVLAANQITEPAGTADAGVGLDGSTVGNPVGAAVGKVGGWVGAAVGEVGAELASNARTLDSSATIITACARTSWSSCVTFASSPKLPTAAPTAVGEGVAAVTDDPLSERETAIATPASASATTTPTVSHRGIAGRASPRVPPLTVPNPSLKTGTGQ